MGTPNGRKHRVGVIGTSWWADLEHLPGLKARGDVELPALCGRDERRLNALADKYAIPARHTDWRKLVEGSGLDVVVLSTPNHLHHPQALLALDRGLHVICEKPLTLDLAQARELAERARTADRRTLTFFSYRTVGAAEHVKRLVADGWLGQVHHVTARYLTASHLQPGKPAQWRMKRAEAGTGVLGDLGSHLIDLVRWWLGDFGRVSAQWQTLTRERRGEAVDADESVSFLADLACGAQASFHASKLVAGQGNWVGIELHGSAGSLVFEADTGFTVGWAGRLRGAKADRLGLEVIPLPADLSPRLEGTVDRTGRDEAYRRLTDPFFASLSGGPAATPDFADGAAVQAVLDAVAASAESGRWVDVERV